jgi:beta-aspartyl-peptidase (threonine type)
MTEQKRRWALIVHGGAKEISPGEEQANREGCLEALEAGRSILEGGGSALDAAEAAVRVLESRPVFNAGYGSVLNSGGHVEMDASIMEGRGLSIGAVGAIKGVRHPISVAKLLMTEDPVLVVGEGAFNFARDNHAELVAPDALITPEQREELKQERDTVGCVAMDQAGNFVAATSTGGLTGAFVGRVGDSPLPGCGFYARNEVGAVAFSGDGEGIARLTLAAQVIGSMQQKGPQKALEQALSQMPALGGDAGGIAISADGRMAWAHNSPDFAVAMVASDWEAPQVWLNKQEDIPAHG